MWEDTWKTNFLFKLESDVHLTDLCFDPGHGNVGGRVNYGGPTNSPPKSCPLLGGAFAGAAGQGFHGGDSGRGKLPIAPPPPCPSNNQKAKKTKTGEKNTHTESKQNNNRCSGRCAGLSKWGWGGKPNSLKSGSESIPNHRRPSRRRRPAARRRSQEEVTSEELDVDRALQRALGTEAPRGVAPPLKRTKRPRRPRVL